jgi:hypothetical protein
MLDKIRCHLRDKLLEEYPPNVGLSVGVIHADLIERMREGG